MIYLPQAKIRTWKNGNIRYQNKLVLTINQPLPDLRESKPE